MIAVRHEHTHTQVQWHIDHTLLHSDILKTAMHTHRHTHHKHLHRHTHTDTDPTKTLIGPPPFAEKHCQSSPGYNFMAQQNERVILADSEREAQSEIKGQSLVSERPVMMIAAVQRERKERKKGGLTRLTASRLAGQLSTERQVLKHCNLDSLLAIVKTLVQSVEGLTGLKSLSVEHPPTSFTAFYSLLSTAGFCSFFMC